MQVTGLSDKLADAIQELNQAGKKVGYESSTNTIQPTLFDTIKDPRLDDAYNMLRDTSTQNAQAFQDDEYGQELGKAVNVPHHSQQDKFHALSHFIDLNQDLAASLKTKKFMNMANTLKQVVGNNAPDFNWDQIEERLAFAKTMGPLATNNVISYFTDELATQILPVAQGILAASAPRPQYRQPPPISAQAAYTGPISQESSEIINGEPQQDGPLGQFHN